MSPDADYTNTLEKQWAACLPPGRAWFSPAGWSAPGNRRFEGFSRPSPGSRFVTGPSARYLARSAPRQHHLAAVTPGRQQERALLSSPARTPMLPARKTDEFEICKLPTSLLALADTSGLNRMLRTLPWLVRLARAIPVFDRQWSCQFCRINRMIFTSVRWPTAGLSRGSFDHERLSSYRKMRSRDLGTRAKHANTEKSSQDLHPCTQLL